MTPLVGEVGAIRPKEAAVGSEEQGWGRVLQRQPGAFLCPVKPSSSGGTIGAAWVPSSASARCATGQHISRCAVTPAALSAF